MANSFVLNQGANTITVATDGTDLTNSTQQIFLNNSQTTKITLTFSDGNAIYLTDFSENTVNFGPSSQYQNVLGIPAAADGGFGFSVNAIPGYGYQSTFDIYNANTNIKIADNVQPSSGFGLTPFAPAVTLQQTAGILVLQNYVGTGMNNASDSEIDTNGEFILSGIGSPYTRTTFATYSLDGSSSGSSNPMYIGGVNANSHSVNGSTYYGQSSFLSTIDSSMVAKLGSGLIGTLGSLSSLITVSALVNLSFATATTTFTSKDVLPTTKLDAGLIASIMADQGVASNMINYVFAADFIGSGTLAVQNNKQSAFVDVLVANDLVKSNSSPLDISLFKGIAVTGSGVNVIGITEANSVIGAGSAQYVMSVGNESMVLNGLNAQVNGGHGIDTVTMQGTSKAGAILTVTGEDRAQLWSGSTLGSGINNFTQVERIVFTDGAIALDTGANEHAGQAYLLYGALNRTADQAGLGYWINALDQGVLVNTVAQAFINSSEFVTNHGANLSAGAFVSSLYETILDRSADASGLNFWTQALQANDTLANRASILEGFAFSAEHLGLVGSQMTHGVQYQVSA
jgi:hypothetical protein